MDEGTINIYTKERFLIDGNLDVRKYLLFPLTMPDNRSWEIGESMGRTWAEGVALRKTLPELD